MIPLGLLFQILMCFLEQHRPIPHLGQRYVQESCNIALSKKAHDLAQCQPWSDYQFSDDQQQYPTTPAVCHLPGTRESALMYYLMQPMWSMQLLVKNSFQSGTKSWQQSTHNGSCRVSYWENCFTIGSWLVPRAVLPHSLTAVSRHHVLALWRTGSWAQCASWEHRLALPVLHPSVFREVHISQSCFKFCWLCPGAPKANILLFSHHTYYPSLLIEPSTLAITFQLKLSSFKRDNCSPIKQCFGQSFCFLISKKKKTEKKRK